MCYHYIIIAKPPFTRPPFVNSRHKGAVALRAGSGTSHFAGSPMNPSQICHTEWILCLFLYNNGSTWVQALVLLIAGSPSHCRYFLSMGPLTRQTMRSIWIPDGLPKRPVRAIFRSVAAAIRAPAQHQKRLGWDDNREDWQGPCARTTRTNREV